MGTLAGKTEGTRRIRGNMKVVDMNKLDITCLKLPGGGIKPDAICDRTDVLGHLMTMISSKS